MYKFVLWLINNPITYVLLLEHDTANDIQSLEPKLDIDFFRYISYKLSHIDFRNIQIQIIKRILKLKDEIKEKHFLKTN